MDFATRVRFASSGIPKTAVEAAIKVFRGMGSTEKSDINNCIMAAGLLRDSGMGGKTNGKDHASPLMLSDNLSSLELVSAIAPWVQKVRTRLFGSAKVPFTSYQDAVKWIEGEFSTGKDLKKQNRDRLRKIKGEIEKKIAQLPRSFSRDFFLTPQTFFIPYQKGGIYNIIPSSTEKLRHLHDESKEMEKATGFDQIGIVAFILADIQPQLAVVRVEMPPPGLPSTSYNLPTGGVIRRCIARLECRSPQELKLAHLKAFYKRMRQDFRIVKKKTLTYEDTQLIALIRRHGLPPRHGSVEYWRSVAKEYNRKTKRRVAPNALRMRWNRLRRGTDKATLMG